jgi:hypothetical protein
MHISAEARRRAFSTWLRTGRLPAASDVEVKFNPYHDPRNGRFTFAPGGPQSLRHVIISDRRKKSAVDLSRHGQQSESRESNIDNGDPQPLIADTIVQDGHSASRLKLQPASFAPDPTRSRRSNIRAFSDPMTLEQVFPGLRNAPGGALIAAADHFFNFTGPAQEMTAEWTARQVVHLVGQIKAINPKYNFQAIATPTTFQGQMNQLNFLRLDRAKAFMQVKGELRPMQIEVLRLMQMSADRAYDRGLKLLRAGRLPIRLSEQEAWEII